MDFFRSRDDAGPHENENGRGEWGVPEELDLESSEGRESLVVYLLGAGQNDEGEAFDEKHA